LFDNGVMSKKKSTPRGEAIDRHKPGRMVRLPRSLADLLAEEAEGRFTNLTQEVIRRLHESLERDGRLPRRKES
jgi:hypothetical protein